MENFDALLYRPVTQGKEFDKLIPEPKGVKKSIGVGDTGFSMKKIAEMVKNCSYQMEEVAKKLQGNSLADSVANVKDFVFNNFQYKADKEDQLLRSPAYAWWIDKYDGIDCKSYSIIASCLLTEMGILHSIRRIKQPTLDPTQWTHVYVIVPLDQEKGGLQNGYYVVDGTLKEDYEPAMVDKDDLPMSLKHYSLNVPAQPGLGLSIGNFSLDNVLSIKNFIGQLSCIGGSAYSQNDMKTILSKMEVYFNGLIARINNAVANGDADEFSKAVTEFYAITELGQIASKKKLSEGWNFCSSNVIKVIIKAWEYYGVTVKRAFDVWLNNYFVKDANADGGTVTYNSSDLYNKYGMGATTVKITITKPLNLYNPKPTSIKKFEITKYVADSSVTTTFDPLQFLSGLSTIAGSFGTSTNPIDANSGQNQGTITDNIGSNTQKAGFGWLGWVVVVAGIGLTANAFAKSPDKPIATRRKTNPKRKTK